MARRGTAMTLRDDLRRPPEGPFGGYRGPVTLGDHLTVEGWHSILSNVRGECREGTAGLSIDRAN